MKIEKKDSGLYCFRLSRVEREELDNLLDSAKVRMNKNRREDEYVITKNQIILEAIKVGLPLIKKRVS